MLTEAWPLLTKTRKTNPSLPSLSRTKAPKQATQAANARRSRSKRQRHMVLQKSRPRPNRQDTRAATYSKYVPLTSHLEISPTGYTLCPQDITHRIYIAPHRISPTGYTLRPTGYYPQDCTSLTQETLFVPKEVVELVASGNIRALMEKANAILDSVQKQPPSGGWEQHLPSWVGARHKRGLLGWGQCRDKATSKVVDKAWAIPKIQRAALTAAITAWMDCVGLPPTCAGQYLTLTP